MEKTCNILVVDDDIYITDIIRNVLEDEGFRVTTANGGQKAIDTYKECKAELIILDIKMPGMDGYEVLKQLRKESELPVIVLSGVQESEAAVRMMDLGANDCLGKPFREKELIARVRDKIRHANLLKD